MGEEDTTVVIAMEVEDTIPREAKDPRKAHTARALTLALMDTCTMGAMMEDTTVVIAMEDMEDTMVMATIPRVAKEETVDTMVVVTIQRVAKEMMVDTMVVVTIQKEVREVEVIVSPSTPLLP